MNKEETIKNIQDIISANCGTISEQFAKSIAETLYNAGYRKVPDGAVILTPEERDEELKACNEKQAELKAEIAREKANYYNQGVIDGREDFEHLKKRNKELYEEIKLFTSNMKVVLEIEKRKAVEEFAEKVKEYINNKVIADFDDSESVQYYTIDLDEFECEIDEILKELTE